jgi:hypothetical protein
VRYARLWPAHAPRAPLYAAGQPSREERRRGALSPRGDLTQARCRRACACVRSRASTRAFCCRWKVLTPCRDAPAVVASSPATRSTRRAPSARSRARAPVRTAHPSAVPRPRRGVLLVVSPLDAEHPDPTPATHRAAAGLLSISSSTWWACEPCAEMQIDKWAAGRIWALSPANF